MKVASGWARASGSTPAPSLSAFLGEGVIQVSEPGPAREAIASLLADPDARARLAEDPFQVDGVVAQVDVRGWNPVLGELFAALA